MVLKAKDNETIKGLWGQDTSADNHKMAFSIDSSIREKTMGSGHTAGHQTTVRLHGMPAVMAGAQG